MSEWLNEADYDRDRIERHIHAEAARTGLSRRSIVRLLAAGAAGLTLSPRSLRAQTPPTIVKPLPADKFRILGTNAETLFEAFKGVGYLTPASLFFVRNHTSTPRIDERSWRLTVSGSGVRRPLRLSYRDLLRFRSVTTTKLIECAGNGRSFFGSQQGTPASGSAWRLGAIGVGKWTGVRLSEILDYARVKRSAVDVQPEGLDAEVGANGHVRRAIPIEKALHDVLLVYGLNGKPLPPDHGFPVRVLVPGWIGISNIKWVGHIEVSEQPLFSAWNTTQYRLFGAEYPDQPVLTRQTLKSAFELPFPATVPAGWHFLTGRSWSAHGSIRRVEVSFDGGKRWYDAYVDRHKNKPQAWAQWNIPWPARPGNHVLKARATDSRGNVQPETVPFNDQGYLFGAVVNHPVTVV